jgi:hypothetical protein
MAVIPVKNIPGGPLRASARMSSPSIVTADYSLLRRLRMRPPQHAGSPRVGLLTAPPIPLSKNPATPFPKQNGCRLIRTNILADLAMAPLVTVIRR